MEIERMSDIANRTMSQLAEILRELTSKQPIAHAVVAVESGD
jgi:hypothetical protein